MRQEAKRRATLQAGLPSLSTTVPTVDREPHGSNLTNPLSSPHPHPNESKLSETDSSTSTRSPTVTHPIIKKHPYPNIPIRMDTDKQLLAEVQTAKMKDCPVLTAGRITPPDPSILVSCLQTLHEAC